MRDLSKWKCINWSNVNIVKVFIHLFTKKTTRNFTLWSIDYINGENFAFLLLFICVTTNLRFASYSCLYFPTFHLRVKSSNRLIFIFIIIFLVAQLSIFFELLLENLFYWLSACWSLRDLLLLLLLLIRYRQLLLLTSFFIEINLV